MNERRLNLMLAAVAIAFGLILVLVDRGGDGRDTAGGAGADWTAQNEAEADHITPVDLATRLLAGQDDTLIVDVRPADEFALWHLPGAVNMDVPTLLGSAGTSLRTSAGDKLVVLVSNGMVHPAQAWVALAQRGATDVRVLEGGLTQFKLDVLTPPSLRGPISEARAAQAWPAFVAAREAFVGHAANVRTAAIEP